MAPFDDSVDPVEQARAIVAELKKYDAELYAKPRWLVLNKLDMVPVEEREARVRDMVKRLRWKGPVHQISALTREGCEQLIREIYQHVHQVQVEELPPEPEQDPRFIPLPDEDESPAEPKAAPARKRPVRRKKPAAE